MAVRHYAARSFTSAKSIGYLMKIAHARLHDRATRAFAGEDISFVQWIALRRLAEGLASSSSDLCRDMNHDTGALTRMIDHLEKHGFVERVRSREDRRVNRLQITPAGHAKLDALTPLVVDRLNEALVGFSKPEFAEFMRLLDKLNGRLAELDALPEGAG